MAKTLAFVGRLLFSMIFIASALQTVQQFDMKTGGPVVAGYAAPKLNAFFAKVSQATGVQIALPKAYLPQVVLTMKIVELLGGLFFALDIAFGAQLLLIFLVPTSVIMHNFWDMPADQQQLEMIMFMKVRAPGRRPCLRCRRVDRGVNTEGG